MFYGHACYGNICVSVCAVWGNKFLYIEVADVRSKHVNAGAERSALRSEI